MPEIHFECPSCNQHIAVPEDLANTLIECPTCNQTIEVPVHSRETPPPPPQVPIQPVCPATSTPQTDRRHGVFYYVFWGTVSLFATLGILSVVAFFLTAAGAGFLSATMDHSTKQAQREQLSGVINLPALTDDEARVADKVIGALQVKKDAFEGITWYSPKVADGYKTAMYLYVAKKDNDPPGLRWKIRYYGDDWLFISQYRIKLDQKEPETLLPTSKIERDNSQGSVWETFDEPAIKHARLINQILACKVALLRMEGRRANEDIELGPQELQKMRDVLLVYRRLGGLWPANSR